MSDDSGNTGLPDDVSDATLGFLLAVSMFLPSFFGATLITDALLGWVGLPLSPLLWLIVAVPLAIVMVHVEDRVQNCSDWERLEGFWYSGGVGALTIPPLALALLAPLPALTGLDRGGPSMVVFVALVLLIVGIVVRGKLRGTA
ncbi:putative citrate-sodium symporter [Rhodococcus sp. AW25M09]|uniref:hypothetical protein n=1 Tax=Rhodococcus sp. AW25M09 TaxID=1268303 RepID=UPI0002ACE708|nr:hypothetical protein [Rhodococcus sp. AW25M09]CCQ14263.1 putative citrate-sodium symporter [Rhodococcus sp. AW25M09]